MSSPITFSGFNNIDFSSILTAMMAQESQPVQALQSQQSALTTQKSNYSTLASKLSTLEDAIKSLSTPSEFGGKTATSTDSSAVAVTADASAPQGNYDVVVDSLARSQTTASATTFTDKDQTIVASSGTLVINGTAVTVTQPASGKPETGAATPLPTGDGHTLNDRGYALMRAGDYAAALPLLRAAVRDLRGAGPADPYEAYANYNLGYSLLRLGRCDRALGPLWRARRLESSPLVPRAIDRARACAAG